MATSPSFSWPEPDNTDLVKNGALAIRTAVNAIDASMTDLKGGTTGQILSKTSNTDMDFTWITNDVGDITAVTAGSGLSGGGTTGAVSLALDLASANIFTAAQTATRFLVTGSTVATNGMYLSAANTLGFSTNSVERLTLSTTTFQSTLTTYNLGNAATGTVGIELGANRTVDGSTYIDLIGDTTYNDAGFRIIRGSGANAVTNLTHRGTGTFGFIAQEAASVQFSTTNSIRMTINSTGRTGVGLILTTTAQFGVNNLQGTGDVTVLTKNFAAQTSESLNIQNSAASLIFGVTAAGLMKYISGNTATTVGAAGAASALPANPTGYLKIDIGGTEYKVPYYAA
jgi:hypothetical protein